MQTLSETLAIGLVERLRAVVPQGFELVAEHGGVTIAIPGRAVAWSHIGVDAVVEQEGDPRHLVESAALSVLSAVQDFVAEWTTDPWPVGDESPLPPPVTSWVGDELHMSYGSGAAPALRLLPLALDLSQATHHEPSGPRTAEPAVPIAPRWVPVVSVVLTGAVILWQRARIAPRWSITSVLAVAIIAVLVYGTCYALLSLASRAGR